MVQAVKVNELETTVIEIVVPGPKGDKGDPGDAGGGAEFNDDDFHIHSSIDDTKLIKFNAGNIDPGKGRTIIMADRDIDLDQIHNHTNKTVLDATTASFTSEEEAKLASIDEDASVIHIEY